MHPINFNEPKPMILHKPNPMVFTPRVYEKPKTMASPLAPRQKFTQHQHNNNNHNKCIEGISSPNEKKKWIQLLIYFVCITILLIVVRLAYT